MKNKDLLVILAYFLVEIAFLIVAVFMIRGGLRVQGMIVCLFAVGVAFMIYLRLKKIRQEEIDAYNENAVKMDNGEDNNEHDDN